MVWQRPLFHVTRSSRRSEFAGLSNCHSAGRTESPSSGVIPSVTYGRRGQLVGARSRVHFRETTWHNGRTMLAALDGHCTTRSPEQQQSGNHHYEGNEGENQPHSHVVARAIVARAHDQQVGLMSDRRGEGDG
jgi:hypothetical protein